MSNLRDDDRQSQYYDRYVEKFNAPAAGAKRSKKPIVIGVATAVVACAAAGTAFALARSDHDSKSAVAGTPTSSATSAPPPSPSSSPTQSSSSSAGPVAVKAPAGWTVARNSNSARDHLNYAVPAAWTVHSKGDSIAWGGNDDDLVGGHAISTVGSCKAASNYNRGTIGVHGLASSQLPNVAARSFALDMATALSEDDKGKPASSIPSASISSVTVANGVKGVKAQVTVSQGGTIRCGTKDARVTVVAVPAHGDISLWFAVTDTSGKDVSPSDIDKIVSTITVG